MPSLNNHVAGNRVTPLPDAGPAERIINAREQAALFPTRIALARWTCGGDLPHLPAPSARVPRRAAWYAQAQANFQGWLERGGLAQPEEDADAPPNDAQVSQNVKVLREGVVYD